MARKKVQAPPERPRTPWEMREVHVHQHSVGWRAFFSPVGDRGPIVGDAMIILPPALTRREAVRLVRMMLAGPDLLYALKEASDHLDYCGYGDRWERECAREEMLEEKISAALELAGWAESEDAT